MKQLRDDMDTYMARMYATKAELDQEVLINMQAFIIEQKAEKELDHAIASASRDSYDKSTQVPGFQSMIDSTQSPSGSPTAPCSSSFAQEDDNSHQSNAVNSSQHTRR